MKTKLHTILSILAAVALACTTGVMAETPSALENVPSVVTLFRNVKVFNGTDDGLQDVDVLVVKNLIKKIGKDLPVSGTYEVDVDTSTYNRVAVRSPMDYNAYTIVVKDSQGGLKKKEVKVNVIDGGGRTLMPGLHDMHVHFGVYRPVAGDQRIDMSPMLLGAVAAARAEAMLMNGFTFARDIGGPSKFLQRAIDAGVGVGPRILPSEALVTQTAGHGDFRNRNDRHPNINGRNSTNYLDEYLSCFADGPTEVRRCVREQMGRGAAQIKMMAGGGVSSEKDPLHAIQFTPAEIRSGVEAAAQYGTYVSVHAFTDESIRMAVENGVKCVEHGPLLTEKGAKLLAKKGVWLVPSVSPLLGLDLEAFKKISSPFTYEKAVTVRAGVETAMKAAVKHKVKMAFGTDLLSAWEQSVSYDDEMNTEFGWLAKFMPNVDVLRMATGNAGALHAMSGLNTPYRDGPTGVVKEGAYADLLLVDGNPLEKIEIMTDPDKNFRIIMKDGVIYKNTL